MLIPIRIRYARFLVHQPFRRFSQLVAGMSHNPLTAFVDMFRTLPRQSDLRNFLMSQECAAMARMVAALPYEHVLTPGMGHEDIPVDFPQALGCNECK